MIIDTYLYKKSLTNFHDRTHNEYFFVEYSLFQNILAFMKIHFYIIFSQNKIFFF